MFCDRSCPAGACIYVANFLISGSIYVHGSKFKSSPDGVFSALLQEEAAILKNTLDKNIPNSWLASMVTSISKPGASSHINPKDFRPFSLSSFIVTTG